MNQFIIIASRIIRFAALAGMACALPAYAQSNADVPNSIQALNVSGLSDGKLLLTVSMKNAPTNLPHDFTTNNPPRIVFDFPNTVSGLSKSAQEFGQGDLRSVNVAQGGSRTRLVVNLSQMMAYEAKADGNNLLITLQGRPASSPTITRFAEPMPGETQSHSLRDIDFHRGKDGEGRIEVDLSDPNTGIDIKQQGNKVIVDFINTSAPQNLQRKLDVVDFGTPVNFIDTFAQGGNVHMVIEPKGLWEQSAYQTDNKFIVEFKLKKVDDSKKKDGPPIYTGEKLTLNFQNILVREALNVIADFTNLNIVISDSVGGNLTLRLKDVPWDQALDIILQSKGLDMRKNGNVVQVAPRDEIAARDKVVMTAEQDIADLEPLRTESFTLSYQKGADVVTLITNKDQRILSKRGSAVVDTRTNILFVQDTSSRLADIRKLISQIDVPVRQVLIEARFVSAGTQFNRNLGGKLSYAGPNQVAGGGFAVPNGQRGTVSAGGINLPNTGIQPNALTFSLFNPSATKILSLELDASEIDGTTKNIASPRVVTADKAPASISSGVQIPYQSVSASGTQTMFKDAALTLNVTPQITPDDHVEMLLSVNQDTVGTAFLTGAPSINTKKLSTKVLVENGGTVVIGGVYTQDVSDSVSKVPLFGDIPLIGWLFKNTIKINNQNELLVFITPKILKDSLNLN